MTATQALDIIELLADGFDPKTGEVIPDNSCLQRGNVVRALMRASRALKSASRAEKKRKDLPNRAGLSWTDEEDEKLLKSFEQGQKPEGLAIEHERTLGAINSRLHKHGKIELQGTESKR